MDKISAAQQKFLQDRNFHHKKILLLRCLLLILLLCLGSAVLSMLRPVRQISQMSVMETIKPRD